MTLFTNQRGGLREKKIFKPNTKSKPLITVITCVLNNEKYLQECKVNKVEPDIYKVSGMTSEEILTYFYETFNFKKIKMDGL